MKTFFAPLSPRPWTSGEQLTAILIMDCVLLLACVTLWSSSLASRSSVIDRAR